MPTLEDIHESLSRKIQEASLDHLSDRATMDTDHFDYETASFASSNTSLCAQANSSISGSSDHDKPILHSIKKAANAHVRGISDTAVLGDAALSVTGKAPDPWTSQDSEHCNNSRFSSRVSILDLSNARHRAIPSVETLIDDGSNTSNAVDIGAPHCILQADLVDDAGVPLDLASTFKYSYLDVEYPTRGVSRRPALLLGQSFAQHRTRSSSFPEATPVRDTSPLPHARLDRLSPTFGGYVPFTTHEHRGKLKRQIKHDDLRDEFRRYGELAKKTDETIQEKEKSSPSRKLLKRLRTLF